MLRALDPELSLLLALGPADYPHGDRFSGHRGGRLVEGATLVHPTHLIARLVKRERLVLLQRVRC